MKSTNIVGYSQKSKNGDPVCVPDAAACSLTQHECVERDFFEKFALSLFACTNVIGMYAIADFGYIY